MLNQKNLNYFLFCAALFYTVIIFRITFLIPITFLLTDKILHEVLEYQLETRPAHTKRSTRAARAGG